LDGVEMTKREEVNCSTQETLLENLAHLTPKDLKDSRVLGMLKAMACDTSQPAAIRQTAKNILTAAKFKVHGQGHNKFSRGGA
jgi:hypothetical protein